MLIVGRENLRKHLPWIIASVLIAVAAGAWYALEAAGRPRWPGGGTRVGLVLGTVAGLIIIFEFLLWPRKQVRAWRRLGSARWWMRAHVWLGLLSVPLVVLHSGFRWGGSLSTALAVLFAAVILSGAFGLAVQNIVPRILLEQVPQETIYSQIELVSNQYATLAESLVQALCQPTSGETTPPAQQGVIRSGPTVDLPPGRGEGGSLAPEPPSKRRRGSHDFGEEQVLVGAPRSVEKLHARLLQDLAPSAPLANRDALSRAFDTEIRPFLEHGRRSRSLLRSADRSKGYFQQLQSALDPAAKPAVKALEDWCGQRRQFDRQARLHFWLHVWVSFHLACSVALVLLLFAHVYFALKYWYPG